MPDHLQSELVERYLARSALFWKFSRDAKFARWQKEARNAAWKSLEWDCDKVFNLLDIFKDETKRAEFLTELFKFILREKVS